MIKHLATTLSALIITALLHAAGDEGIQLSGFEDPIKDQWKHQNPADTKVPFIAEKSPDKVKEGTQSAKWANLPRNKWIELSNTPKDWTPYTALSIWVFSENANKQKINVVLTAEADPNNKGGYYHHQFIVEWTGWRQLVIPFQLFKAHRNPAPMSAINAFRLSAGGWDTEALSDTVLYLDDLRLLP